MGVKNSMPADERIFDFYIETLNRLAPDAQWCAACIGPSQYKINKWAISKRGHTRTALKNNDRLDRDTLAPSNAPLVQRAVDLCEKYDRLVATWQQARDILGFALRADGRPAPRG
jgi:3-keto-5-aminohexanoate cleavage enzyme